MPSPPPVVTDDKPCIRCGYSLAGLPVTGVCPECGTRIEHSIRADSFDHTPLPHLRTLRAGALLLALSFPHAGVGVFMALLALDGSPGLAVLARGLLIASLLAATLGWWLFTSRDRSRIAHKRNRSAAHLSRATLLAASSVALLWLGPGPFWFGWWPLILIPVCLAATLLSGAVHARDVANRSLDADLVRMVEMMSGFLIALVATAVLLILVSFAGGIVLDRIPHGVMQGVLGAVIVLELFAISGLVMGFFFTIHAQLAAAAKRVESGGSR